ncbi:zinc ribbon domain-containing protein YjdM [Pontiella agarivorans]|uniref:Zinc ribbon domain-containing protein YjdM n=1 Tax=Pontiella agarivorans TaxID=3038953 RepID=A0ABU5MZP5_9BACT|nr:zinc ribbon domain-containing protein YjdM [Pontiella agarivorans]MDZ8119653.1 zinc ribbon domain-containing protein YjdM [Pontiella agarivorans]
MSNIPNCPECGSEYAYEVQDLFNCPDCGHEWSGTTSAEDVSDEPVVKDAVGNILQDGDSITVAKDLKVKGASQPLKVGTKVKSIRLVEGDHNIDCKIPGFGPMKLKSEFVKKA